MTTNTICNECKYSGDKSGFIVSYFHGNLCERCYTEYKFNNDSNCKICHKYCTTDNIHNGHIICSICWNTYTKVKNLIY